MYLSRIQLRPEAATDPRLWDTVRSGYDVHRLIWSWFADSPDRRRDFLYRHEEAGASSRFFTLSARVPKDSSGLWAMETKPFTPKFTAGDRLGFMVRVNPTVRRVEGLGKGGRHDVVMDAKTRARAAGREPPPAGVLMQEEGVRWLAARAEASGFALEDGAARVESYTQTSFRRPKGGREATVSMMDIQGVLTISDPRAFLELVRIGLGPAKGFGCGLMLLRRA